MQLLLLILLVFILLSKFLPIIEFAAGSPATLTQLATSSTTTLPFAYGAGWHGPNTYFGPPSNTTSFPAQFYGGVRPVLQRGAHFWRPSYHR